MTAIRNYKAAREIVRADEQSMQDARDLIVLAAGGAYLQAIAARARVESAKAQLATAEALYKQTEDRHKSGLGGSNRRQYQSRPAANPATAYGDSGKRFCKTKNQPGADRWHSPKRAL